MQRVKARKDAISAKSRTGLEAWLKNMDNCTVYEGHARFESPHDVSVGPQRLTAPRIFINVGGRAVVPLEDHTRRIHTVLRNEATDLMSQSAISSGRHG